MTIDWTQIILAVVTGAFTILGQHLGNRTVPHKVADQLANAVTPEAIGNILAGIRKREG